MIFEHRFVALVTGVVPGLPVLHPTLLVHARQHLHQSAGHVDQQVPDPPRGGPAGHEPTRLPAQEGLRLPGKYLC